MNTNINPNMSDRTRRRALSVLFDDIKWTLRKCGMPGATLFTPMHAYDESPYVPSQPTTPREWAFRHQFLVELRSILTYRNESLPERGERAITIASQLCLAAAKGLDAQSDEILEGFFTKEHFHALATLPDGGCNDVAEREYAVSCRGLMNGLR